MLKNFTKNWWYSGNSFFSLSFFTSASSKWAKRLSIPIYFLKSVYNWISKLIVFLLKCMFGGQRSVVLQIKYRFYIESLDWLLTCCFGFICLYLILYSLRWVIFMIFVANNFYPNFVFLVKYIIYVNGSFICILSQFIIFAIIYVCFFLPYYFFINCLFLTFIIVQFIFSIWFFSSFTYFCFLGGIVVYVCYFFSRREQYYSLFLQVISYWLLAYLGCFIFLPCICFYLCNFYFIFFIILGLSFWTRLNIDNNYVVWLRLLLSEFYLNLIFSFKSFYLCSFYYNNTYKYLFFIYEVSRLQFRLFFLFWRLWFMSILNLQKNNISVYCEDDYSLFTWELWLHWEKLFALKDCRRWCHDDDFFDIIELLVNSNLLYGWLETHKDIRDELSFFNFKYHTFYLHLSAAIESNNNCLNKFLRVFNFFIITKNSNFLSINDQIFSSLQAMSLRVCDSYTKLFSLTRLNYEDEVIADEWDEVEVIDNSDYSEWLMDNEDVFNYINAVSRGREQVNVRSALHNNLNNNRTGFLHGGWLDNCYQLMSNSSQEHFMVNSLDNLEWQKSAFFKQCFEPSFGVCKKPKLYIKESSNFRTKLKNGSGNWL